MQDWTEGTDKFRIPVIAVILNFREPLNSYGQGGLLELNVSSWHTNRRRNGGHCAKTLCLACTYVLRIYHRFGKGSRSFANNNEHSVHIFISEVTEFLNDYYLLERNSARCSFLHTFVQKPERLALVWHDLVYIPDRLRHSCLWFMSMQRAAWFVCNTSQNSQHGMRREQSPRLASFTRICLYHRQQRLLQTSIKRHATNSYFRGRGLLCASLCEGYKLQINKYNVNHNSIDTFVLKYYILGLFWIFCGHNHA